MPESANPEGEGEGAGEGGGGGAGGDCGSGDGAGRSGGAAKAYTWAMDQVRTAADTAVTFCVGGVCCD